MKLISPRLNIHVAYKAHTGGGAEELVDTSDYGTYSPPQGRGQWVLGIMAHCPSPAIDSYVRVDVKEWDDEDIYIVPKDVGFNDPEEIYWLPKPRFLPGGADLKFYSKHGVAEDVYISLITREDGPMPNEGAYQGETVIDVSTHVANTTAKTWTKTETYKFPHQKGPFLITGAKLFSATGIASKIRVPNALQSVEPPIAMSNTPAAGVESSGRFKLPEPIEVAEGETVEIWTFAVGGENVIGYIEYLPSYRRGDVPKNSPVMDKPAPKIIAQSGGKSRNMLFGGLGIRG